MTRAQAMRVLSQVRFRDWQFFVHGEDSPRFDLRFKAPDPETGIPMPQVSRAWLIEPDMDEAALVRTAWLAVQTAVEHEAREDFRYQGVPIFGPHQELPALLAA